MDDVPVGILMKELLAHRAAGTVLPQARIMEVFGAWCRETGCRLDCPADRCRDLEGKLPTLRAGLSVLADWCAGRSIPEIDAGLARRQIQPRV